MLDHWISFRACLWKRQLTRRSRTNVNTEKKQKKKGKSAGMYDRFPVRSAVTFPRQFMKGVYEWK